MSVRLDPRAKLLLLLLCALTVFFSLGLWYEVILMVIIALYGVSAGCGRISAIMVMVYAVAMLAAAALSTVDLGALGTMMSAFFQLVRKVFPCALLAAIIIASTHVNEFMSAMNRLHWPQTVVIPLAVMLRYVPAINEDWGFIKDAMRMRGVNPSLWGFIKSPGRTVECLYVPLMMSASRVSDELSAAAISRGIENPQPRTCFQEISWKTPDTIATVFAGVLLMCAIVLALM